MKMVCFQELMKKMSTIIFYDKLNTSDIFEFEEICLDTFNSKPTLDKVALGQNFPVLVIFSAESAIDLLIEEPPIAINQMIFFLSLNDMIVFEKYQVISFSK